MLWERGTCNYKACLCSWEGECKGYTPLRRKIPGVIILRWRYQHVGICRVLWRWPCIFHVYFMYISCCLCIIFHVGYAKISRWEGRFQWNMGLSGSLGGAPVGACCSGAGCTSYMVVVHLTAKATHTGHIPLDYHID